MIKTITQINISDAEITGIRYLSGNELFVLGHYPHLTMFPGVLSLMLIRLLIQLYCSKNNKGCGKIGVCCYSGLAERNAEYHVNSIFYRS